MQVFIGLGSNLLVRDGGFAGTVILMHDTGATLRLDGELVHATAGVAAPKVARFAARHDLQGAEFLAGIPGTLGGAHIAGVQSNNIVSTIKHFALNSQETGRMVVDARIGEAALRMSDLLAFQIAIEKGKPASVMCAYNKVNGDWACENDFLLNQVLKRDWGFSGWVMSDWGGVHSTEKAAKAGLDQQSGQELDRAMYFDTPLKEAVEAKYAKQGQ